MAFGNGPMRAERQGETLRVENFGPGRREYPVNEHEIIDAQPPTVGHTRYVEDQDGQWWAAGWRRTGPGNMAAVAWPHTRLARIAGRGDRLKDCATTGAVHIFEGAIQ